MFTDFEKFDIGEIAILQNMAVSSREGGECTVIGEFRCREYLWPNRRGRMSGFCWVINIPGIGVFSAEADQLKKRRPPQDWRKLCKLQELSANVPTTSLVGVV